MNIELKKFINNAGCKTPNSVLVIGVIHGDEPQGEYLIKKYLNETKTRPFNIKNNLYYIPRLNPSNTRKNLNGVDINRNFPTKNWELEKENSDYFGGSSPESEAETRFLINLTNKIEFDAILTIHSPYKVVNYDGPGESLANIVSNFLGYPVEKDIGYPTPGSMGTYFGIEKNIPIITVEIDETIPTETLYPNFFKVFQYLENEY